MYHTFMLLAFVFLSLLALLISVPIDLEGQIVRGKTSKTRLKIGWLFGLIQRDLAGEEGRKPAEEEETGEDGGGVWGARCILDILRTEGLIGNVEQLSRGVIGTIRVKTLRIRLRIGFDDPADTGLAVGLFWLMVAPLEALESLDVEIEPTFSEVALEGEAEGAIRVWPIRAVPPVLRFGLSGPTIRAVWKVVKMGRSE